VILLLISVSCELSNFFYSQLSIDVDIYISLDLSVVGANVLACKIQTSFPSVFIVASRQYFGSTGKFSLS
jgi:hypothetical protein